MLVWTIVVILCVVSLMASSAFTTVAPKISKKVKITDAPEVTPPPPINIDEYPLQTRDPEKPVHYLYSSATPTR